MNWNMKFDLLRIFCWIKNEENRDYKTVIREPFANDLAHMLNEWAVPFSEGGGVDPLSTKIKFFF